MPCRKRSDIDYPDLSFPYWTPEADMAHEVIKLLINSLIMKVKIMTIKQNHFLYNISVKKAL